MTAVAIARSASGVATYLTPAGPLVDDAVKALAEAIDSSIAAGRTNVTVDLHRVTLVNGKAIEALLDANARLTGRGGRLQFAEASPLVRDILLANRVVDAPPAPGPGRRLGDILVEMGVLTDEQLGKALRSQTTTSLLASA